MSPLHTGWLLRKRGFHVQDALGKARFEDLAFVAPPTGEFGRRDDAVGGWREGGPQRRGGPGPDEDRKDRGAERVPAAARGRDGEPAGGEPDLAGADRGAGRVADDVAHAGVSAGDPLLGEFDGEGEQGAGDCRAQHRHAAQGQADPEGDEQDQVLEQLGEGAFTAGEAPGPATGGAVAALVERGEQDEACRRGDNEPGEELEKPGIHRATS